MKIKILLFFFIFLIAVFTRAIEPFNRNPIFGFDQGREWMAARDIVQNHKMTLIGTELGAGVAGINGIFHGPVYYYMLAVPYFLFKGDPAGSSWFMLFFGLAAILTGYFFGKKVFNFYFGVIMALFIAVSPMLIPQSRFLWSPHMVSLFILLLFYLVYRLQESKPLIIFLTGFFSAFLYNFEFAITIPLILSVTAYSIYLFRLKFKTYIYLALGIIVAFSPMILFEIRHNFIALSGFYSYIFNHEVKTAVSGTNYFLDHLNSFLSNFAETFPLSVTLPSFILLPLLLLSSVYVWVKETNKKRKDFLLFLVSLPFVTFFVLSFLRNTVWSYYLTHLNIAYIVLFTYLLFFFYNNKFSKIFIGLCILSSVMLVAGIYDGVNSSFYNYKDYGGSAKLKGKTEALDYMYKDSAGKKFGLLVFSPPVYTYPYDYLAQWYGEKKYGYIPYKDKKGTVYLLIEVDSRKPWSYKGWLETVIKTGRIEKTVELPTSGFIVQKRIYE